MPSPGWNVTVALVRSSAGAWHERDGRARAQLGRGVAGFGEAGRERHRVAGGVRGGDELLGAGRSARLLGARRPAHGLLADGAGGRGDDRAVPLEQAALPDDFCFAIRSHYSPSSSALTVTSTPAFFRSRENGQPWSAR